MIPKLQWLIHSNMENDNVIKRLVRAVGRSGANIRCVNYKLGDHIRLDMYDHSDCVVCYGGIDFIQYLNNNRITKFIPGPWFNLRNLRCSTYYAYFGRYLLNQPYNMLPLGDLCRQLIGRDYCLFLRPDIGTKPFVGQVIDSKTNNIKPILESVGPETLVITSTPKIISNEWRFVACNREIVAGCQYLPSEESSYGNKAFVLAQKICQHEWQPDLCYVIDIVQFGNNVYLLELNSFSCSGFYQCDLDRIVGHANQAAVSEWKDYHK
ncbi:MAG: ATP-grasp domain-containing protein [Candidatus Heimdallarchaeota archaeon]|nr:MAG: ATP-grasp domain-containing protein [Candidatus Heimdallarchaeota archaeon]